MSEALRPVVVVGLGELGGVFGSALLKQGHPVVPVLRSTPIAEVEAAWPHPALVLVTVGEDDLAPAIERLPQTWRTRLGLVQNELLPRSWQALGIQDPTVAVVWFEKKAGRQVHEVVPTTLAGPQAQLLGSALRAYGLRAREVPDADLLAELVAKNLYILALNLAGLEVQGNAGDLLAAHRRLLDDLTEDILRLQRALAGSAQAASLDDTALRAALETAIASDPAHGLAGRSAPRRLERNLMLARELGLTLPVFERLGARHLQRP